MKNEHTKGEWKSTIIDVSEDNSFPYSIVTGESYHTVCIVESQDTYEEFEANAKLIAAAPELLGALIEALDYIKAIENDNFEESETYKYFEKTIQKATK